MTKYLYPIIRNPLLRMRVRVLIQIASFNLFWEKLWPRLLPLVIVFGLFFAVVLLDLLPILPSWLHFTVLAGFAACAAYSLRRLIAVDYRILEAQARHRLELDSKILHRPLEALDDKPVLVNTDPNAEYIWQMHKNRMAAELKKLKIGLPSPGMAQRDPFGLRVILLLILVIAGAAGTGDARARLERALIPKEKIFKDLGLSIDFWITPPAYTGIAPIFLENSVSKKSLTTDDLKGQGAETQSAVIRVPVGSSFLGQSNSAEAEAILYIGQRKIFFNPFDPSNPSAGTQVEGTITKSDVEAKRLEVNIGGSLKRAWPVQIDVDKAPQVDFTQLPKKKGRGVLQVEFNAQDDFGIADVDLIIGNPQGRPMPGGNAEVKINLPVSNLGTPKIKGNLSQDFMEHPWAGTLVTLKLLATDTAGQIGNSETISLVLPERIFNHPVARAIISVRKELNRPERRAVLDAIRHIKEISKRPAHFFSDTVVFLNLAVSRARLLHDVSPKSVAGVQRLLWKTALRLEDGEFAIADRDLENAQRQLLEAFRNSDMSSMELNRLMNKLQAAMNNYMRALAERFKKEGVSKNLQQSVKKIMESGDLQRLVDKISELMETGAINAAKELYSQLNQMLEAIRHGARMARQQRGPNHGRKILQRLRELSSRQQQLLDKTFRKIKRRNILETRQPSFDIASQQETLRDGLDKLMRQVDEILGEVPTSMGEAERAMTGARQSLARGDREGAVSWQTKALERLRNTAEGLAEKLARRSRDHKGILFGRQGQQLPRSRDPFGRRSGIEGASGELGNSSVKIPNSHEIRRSREILNELRFRSSDRERSKIELRYIDRLISQF